MPSTRPDTASLPIVLREKSFRRAARTVTRYRTPVAQPRGEPGRITPPRRQAAGTADASRSRFAALERRAAHPDLAAERGPVGGRRGAEHAGEVLPQDGCRAEAALVRDAVEAEVGLLEQSLSVDDPLASEPCGRRRAVVGLEPARERARRHVRLRRELVDRELHAAGSRASSR